MIQVFDSWAGHLSPKDYDVFAAPYQVSGSMCIKSLVVRRVCYSCACTDCDDDDDDDDDNDILVYFSYYNLV